MYTRDADLRLSECTCMCSWSGLVLVCVLVRGKRTCIVMPGPTDTTVASLMPLDAAASGRMIPVAVF
jgi:hypothetical protein